MAAKDTTSLVRAEADASVRIQEGLTTLQAGIADVRELLDVALKPIDLRQRTLGESFRGATDDEVALRLTRERSARVEVISKVLEERTKLARQIQEMARAAFALENLAKSREAARIRADLKVLHLEQQRLRIAEDYANYQAEQAHRDEVRRLQRERELADLRAPKTAASETAEERAVRQVDAELARRRAATAAESALIADFIRQAEEVFVDSAISDTERMLKLRALLEVYGMESADLPGAVREFLHSEEASGV